MIQGEHVPRFDITLKQGADYKLTIQFEADDESEIADYGVMIQNENLYIVDGSVMDEEAETLICSDGWGVVEEEERIYTTGKWKIESHLREFAEASDYFEFTVGMTGDGFFLRMPHAETRLIPYSKGVYDVFLVDEDGTRTKILMGQARIIREVTR